MILGFSITLAMLVASPAAGQYDGYVAPVQPTPAILRQGLFDRLRDIRADGVEQKARDGGTLTRAHRDALQARIDATIARYANQMRSIGFYDIKVAPAKLD